MASGLPDAVRAMTPTDSLEISLVPEQKDSAHARFYDDAGSASVSRYRRTPCYLLKDGEHRHPEVGFRRSMAGLRTPLSTLRIDPRGPLRMTRGRCGSLNLHRKGLALSTSCRSPGAPVHIITFGPCLTLPLALILHDDQISYADYRFPAVIIQQAIHQSAFSTD